MREKVAVIFIGIPASGKSTFFREYFSDYVHMNLDTLKKRSKEKRLLDECVEKGLSFVVDNTNPSVEDRARYIPLAKENGYRVIGYYFQSSVSDCLERNGKREGKARVPDSAVKMIHGKLEIPKYSEGFDELHYVCMKDGRFEVSDWKEE